MAKPREFTATLVGLFLFVGLAILGLLILRFGNVKRGDVARYPLTISFTDATGLLKGTDVRLGGAVIGSVQALPRLNATFDRVLVDVEINEGIGIPRNAEISTAGAGLLGDKYVSIMVPAGTEPEKTGYFKAGETIEGISAGSLASLQMKVEDLSLKAGNALGDVQGAIVRISSAVDEFEKVARNVNVAVTKFNDGILAEENLASLRQSMQNLEKTSANFASASEKLGPTLDKGAKLFDEVDATLGEIKGVFAEVKPVAGKLQEGVGKIGAAAESVNRGVKRLTEGDGVLPALVNDRSLADEVRALAENLRRRGILFYRDEAGAEEAPARPARRAPVSPRSHSQP
jgi:phospholipid/cholesterol/gamma-HCH transport system substrate-binding protein